MVDPTPLRSANCREELERLRGELQRRELELHRRDGEIARLVSDNSRLHGLAYRDTLTGVGSRLCFDEKLEHLLHINDPLSLVLIDLDHFKQVNDQYGHLAGDAVLTRFGAILRTVSQERDTCARIGGEEFAVLLRNRTAAEVEHFTDSLLRHVREDLVVHLEGGEVINATVSIGSASYSNEGTRAFFGRADKALYEAKEQGRNRAVAAKAVA